MTINRRVVSVGFRAGLSARSDIVKKTGVTYFMFSECGKFMKIGRLRRGCLANRVRCVNREPAYKGLDLSVGFTIDDSRLEIPMHRAFVESRMHYWINRDAKKNTINQADATRCTYRDMCEYYGYEYKRSDINIPKGNGCIELFKTDGMSKDEVRTIVINRIMSMGIRVK